MTGEGWVPRTALAAQRLQHRESIALPRAEAIRNTREGLIKLFAKIMIITVPIGAALGYYYLLQIPEAARAMIPTAMMTG